MDLDRRGRAPGGVRAGPGTRFRFIGKPFPGWNGIVRCEVLAVDEPSLLRYDWHNEGGGDTTVVTNRLRSPGRHPADLGAHRVPRHRGSVHVRLLGRVRRKMLSEGLPAVLADIGDDGRLRPGSTLRARP